MVSCVDTGVLSDGLEEDARGIFVICERHIRGHNGETGLVVGPTNDLSYFKNTSLVSLVRLVSCVVTDRPTWGSYHDHLLRNILEIKRTGVCITDLR